MKSLYGTIINHSPRSLFEISKVYPNVVSMQADKPIGGKDVPPNGYVLINYTQSDETENQEGLYNNNFSIDNQGQPEGLTVDYHQTVWQKRYTDSSKTNYEYFAIARLHSILPYMKESKLKGYKNEVVFQRANAFPLQGELSEVRYKDFGTRRDLSRQNLDGSFIHFQFEEAINFDKETMEKFNEAYPSVDFDEVGEKFILNTDIDINEVNNKLKDYNFNFTDERIFSNLHLAYENINNDSIPENSYILIDYTKKTEEDLARENEMDKYTSNYEDLILNENSEAAQLDKIQRYNKNTIIDKIYFGIADNKNYDVSKNNLIQCFNKYNYKIIFTNDLTVQNFQTIKTDLTNQINNLTTDQEEQKQILIDELTELENAVNQYEKELSDINNNEDNKKLIINYHGVIFQKQINNNQSIFTPIDINRLQLKPVTINSDDLPKYADKTNLESSRTVTYMLSHVNSKDFQQEIANEILRTESTAFIAQYNLNQMQDIVRNKTEQILNNIATLSKNMKNNTSDIDCIDDCANEIKENITLIEGYDTEVVKCLQAQTEAAGKITENISNINSKITNIKNNEYKTINQNITNIKNDTNNISSQITTISSQIDQIETHIESINSNQNALSESLQETIAEINGKLSSYKTALTNANNRMSTALTAVNNASSNLNSAMNTLSSQSSSISIAVDNINTNVTNINNATNITNAKTYASTIGTNATNINTAISAINSINLSSIKTALDGINLSAIADPGYTNYSDSFATLDDIIVHSENITDLISDIEDGIENIEQYCTNISGYITTIQTQLTNLTSRLNELSSYNGEIDTQNKIIITQIGNLEDRLEELRIYKNNIKTQKNNIITYNNTNLGLEAENQLLTTEIKQCMNIAEDQLNLFNIANNEYTLYFGMWYWYQGVFLPSIDNIDVDTLNKRMLPTTCSNYNTETIEYPTR